MAQVSIIPIAKRIIEFQETDFRTNPDITSFSEGLLSEKDWENFSKNALLIVQGKDILQYTEEYPIVKYKDNNSLNVFVKSITISTACHGKSFSLRSGRPKSEIRDFDTVVYYEDSFGVNHGILQRDICNFLLKKPNLVVSPEGVLVFFTSTDILCTIDCQHYCWIKNNIIDMSNKHIIDITAGEEFCKVTLSGNSYNHYFRLKFSFNMLTQTIIPHAEKL